MISENESNSSDSLSLNSDEFGDDEDEYFMDSEVDAPPPSKRSKSLPTDEERAVEFRDVTNVNLTAIILQCAKTMETLVEKLAATSSHLKETHKRYLRVAAWNMRS